MSVQLSTSNDRDDSRVASTSVTVISVKFQHNLKQFENDGRDAPDHRGGVPAGFEMTRACREEEERHMRNLNEDEQLKKQIAEIEDCVKESEHKLQE
ncbi:hypothetical protein RRG08_024106 [Elysia crispata]|uniref:Uncharacterized protein n=1 Tax=Elysia crispata TaxID=231223 RepID=A0AAE1BBZ4_9GAST|nr:hypothetical protein RRG08_024106 [Elysia crispata]